ncbi:MAG TPA: ABC transporter permease [Polyangia bacterium]|jgi:ABC-type polysaccharide/polyol phosphate export permease|nr:ABC transporter permease [Polyangia bacterium]
MLSLFRILRRHRDLLYMLTLRDIKVKYKQSVMGFFWAILMPLIITSAGVVVKVGLAKVAGRPIRFEEVLSVSVKALPWAFFVATIRFATVCLTANQNLVTKIAFPRAVFPLAAVASQLIDFCVAGVVLVLVFIFSPLRVSIDLLYVPLLIAILIAQLCGMALLFSAANLFFRDVKYIVEVILTFAIFFTPVFYDASLFGKWGQLLLLNPVAPILEGFSAAIVNHHAPNLGWTLYAAVWGVVLFFGGSALFQQLEPKFAESI